MVGVLPKGPGVGPDSALPRGHRSRDGSGMLPFEIGLSAGIGDSRSTRHGDERGKVEKSRKVLWKDGDFRLSNGKTYILGLGINQDTYHGSSIFLICPGTTSVSSFSHGP
jgi:hypothetical protein